MHPAPTDGDVRPASKASIDAGVDIKRFAELVKAKEHAEQAARQADRDRVASQRAARDAEISVARRLSDVRADKDRAAARLKDLRARGAATASVAEAELAYRDALGLLMAVERGEDPALLVTESVEAAARDGEGSVGEA